MCRLPDLPDYLKQTQEQRDETAWEFMRDTKEEFQKVRVTLGWHWKAGAGVVGILIGASSMGMAIMDKVGEKRDERIEAIELKVNTSLAELGKLHERDDRRYVADSIRWHEVQRWMERVDRRLDRR